MKIRKKIIIKKTNKRNTEEGFKNEIYLNRKKKIFVFIHAIEMIAFTLKNAFTTKINSTKYYNGLYNRGARTNGAIFNKKKIITKSLIVEKMCKF